jgi:hypothetical protein
VSHLRLKPEQIRALVEKQVVAQSLSSKNEKGMAALGLVMADGSADAFVESYRTLATFKQNPSIVACGKFSVTPTVADLAGLTVDEKDLYALSRSSVRDSDIKLSEAEMAKFRALAPASANLTPQLKAKLATEFKKMLVERVKSYLAGGGQSLGVYSDQDNPINANEAFAELSREQAKSALHCDHLYSYLEGYPQSGRADCESFIYWAKQKFGDLKPLINVVQVIIHKEGDRTLVASKQLYSTHYTEAALSVAELIQLADVQGSTRTLVIYTIRLRVDVLGGSFGFMKRRLAQPRMVGTLKHSLGGMRSTMEALSLASAQAKTGGQ